MDSDSYGDDSEIDYSAEDSDYGFDAGADEQPRARQARAAIHHAAYPYGEAVMTEAGLAAG